MENSNEIKKKSNWLPFLITALISSVISITLTLSAISYKWINPSAYQVGPGAWWSIFSTILNILLLCFSLWQYLKGQEQGKRNKAQIKIWMLDAKGILNALIKVQTLKHTKTSDAHNAISMIEAAANAMHQSLYEERVLEEEDYKESEKRKIQIADEQEMQALKGRASAEANPVRWL
ncbi:MAG: hypothetical protein WDN09_03455 [bacterium]